MKRIALVMAAVATVPLMAMMVFAQGMPPTLVETSPVTTMEFHDQITLVGKTEARAVSSIVAEVSGRVVRVNAPEGTPVERGTVLVSIDSRRIQFQLDAKRAQVAQAKAAAELAEKNLARTENLHGRELAADGEYDRDAAEQIRSREFYNQLLAEQKSLELDLSHCSVRSPFAGYTVRKLVDVGEGVSPGTAVYEVVDLGTIKVTVALPERHFGHVEMGSSVVIRVSGGGEPVVGQVAGFAPNASSDTHTFPVIIMVDNADGRLGGGMLVRATVSLDEVFTSLAVHKDAVVRQGPQTMVYTINEGKAAPIPVMVGSMSGDYVSIQGEGIAEGMPVVTRGNERIFPGSPVRTGDGPPGGGGAPGQAGEEQADDTETAQDGGS
jgi:RND family efflux transporter MFP subunit